MGVSETAPTDTNVKPAPPVDPKLPGEEEEVPVAAAVEEEEDDGKARVILPPELKDKVSIEMEEIDDDDNVVPPHDEL